jgi:hypothetical protein
MHVLFGKLVRRWRQRQVLTSNDVSRVYKDCVWGEVRVRAG